MGKTPRIKCKITGPLSVDGVAPGNYVDLDPRYYNIRQLIEAGHVALSKESLKALEDFEKPTEADAVEPDPEAGKNV